MIGNVFTSLPGAGTVYETFENEFRWGRDYNHLYAGGVLSSASRDAGSTPTTTHRSGLVLGTITASGKLTAYASSATDGSNVATGILVPPTNVLDRGGVAADQMVWIIVGGPVKPANLYGFDDTARLQMAGRFQFDDRGYASTAGGALSGTVTAKTANYTVLAADSGTTFTNQGASGAVTFTLPTTLVRGFVIRVEVEADNNVTVAAPAGKLVAFNNAAATSVAFSTTSQKIGGVFEVRTNADATKYLVAVLSSGNTVTVA